MIKKNHSVTFFPILFFFIILTMPSCEALDKEESIPAYLHLSEWRLVTTLDQGSDHHNFKLAEVFVGDEHIGIYELPSTFPVLKEGSHEVRIFPGIYVNGIKATPAFYKVCLDSRHMIDHIPGDTIYLDPVSKYETATIFHMIEDFEGFPLLNKELDNDLQTTIRKTDLDPVEGSFSGVVVIDGTHSIFESTTINSYSIDIDRLAAAYIEIEYKTNIEFAVGIQGENNEVDFTRLYPFILRPNDEWNKVYLNITDFLKESIYPKHRINLAAQWATTDQVQQGEIYLDNIKLISFGN